MTTQEKVLYVRRAISQAMGDDLERADIAFKGMTETQLDQQWGQSGKTVRQIWQGYKDDRARWKEVLEWIEGLMPQFTL